MKIAAKILAILLMLCCVAALVPSGAYGEIIEIPLDADRGLPPYEDCYLSDTEYEDPSIHVTMGSGKIYRTNYWYAYVKIANASQLRTAMAGSFKRNDERTISSFAEKLKPVLCMTGDDFSKRGGVGYVARQGVEYLKACDKVESRSKRHLDVLIIDEKGDMHILPQATNADIDAYEGTVIQGFAFGPGLVIDGVVQDGDIVDMSNAPFQPARRICLAQTGPLEYFCLMSEGPDDRSIQPKVGLTIPQFIELLSSFEGIQNAYMMDGGSAAGMVFKGKRVNPNGRSRPLKDVVYFASAYVAPTPTEAPDTDAVLP